MSIAIFNNKKDADDYSEAIHAHLIANRPRYNAERWSFENKADNKIEYAVKIPSDLGKIKVKMNQGHLTKSDKKIEKYPKDWKKEKKLKTAKAK